jgi:hypothetical protein
MLDGGNQYHLTEGLIKEEGALCPLQTGSHRQRHRLPYESEHLARPCSSANQMAGTDACVAACIATNCQHASALNSLKGLAVVS